MAFAFAVAITMSAGLASTTTPVFAQSEFGIGGLSPAALDSARVALSSADWNERHAALALINDAYPDVVPSVLTWPIIELIAREGRESADHVGDEDYGEYLVDLVLTGVRTGDARAVPGILMLDGLGMSSGVASFVASQGRSVIPSLDALAQTREDRASDVAETYALMYARYGARLTRADSAQVLQRLLQAATHASPAVRAHLTYVAARGPIPELLPLTADLVNSDPGQLDGVYVVRQDAGEAVPALQRARAAMPTAEILNRLTLLTDAACDPADARLAAPCAALRGSLADAARQLAAGQRTLAVKALDVYVRDVQRLGVGGLLPRLTVVTLDGTGRAVIARLVA